MFGSTQPGNFKRNRLQTVSCGGRSRGPIPGLYLLLLAMTNRGMSVKLFQSCRRVPRVLVDRVDQGRPGVDLGMFQARSSVPPRQALTIPVPAPLCPQPISKPLFYIRYARGLQGTCLTHRACSWVVAHCLPSSEPVLFFADEAATCILVRREVDMAPLSTSATGGDIPCSRGRRAVSAVTRLPASCHMLTDSAPSHN